MKTRDSSEPIEWEYLDTRSAQFIAFRSGAIVKFVCAAGNELPPPGARLDTRIGSQSGPSRRRAAFHLAQAECAWRYMAVLTWRVLPDPPRVKAALRKFARAFRARWGHGLDAWVLEIQARGCPHYHLFFAAGTAFASACDNSPRGTRDDGAEIVRGAPDKWIVGAWLAAIGPLAPDDDGASFRFNRRGILEPLRFPDAAGRYAAKEAGKRAQKVLPDRYAGGLGRWWWLAPHLRPQPRGTGPLDLTWWPWDTPLSHVWETESIAEAIQGYTRADVTFDCAIGAARYTLPDATI